MIENGTVLHGFVLERQAWVDELDGRCLLFSHERSGARLLKVLSPDDNKVFAVTFRTPPVDDSGLPHIMEHSVLNGSERFPVKSPFDVLSQGSLKTFLNAMTGSDMTIYPVASRNDKDFRNLMHVYLDAVFKPLIHREPRIFQQEGWHYELEAVDAPLTCTGVVYNEMKGAFSAPQRLLDLHIGRRLFPDNCYSRSSGGHPDAIPELDQDRFTAYHRVFYHPANSYIYLYGNGDLDDELEFIDGNYLSAYEKRTVPSDIPLQAPLRQVPDIVESYPLPQGVDGENQTYIAWAGVYGRCTDQETTICLDILAEALVNHQNGPLRLALQQAGIGQDVAASVDRIQQPVFQITIDNARPEDFSRFKEILDGTVRQACKTGLDRTMLEGIVNRMEFSLREGQGSFTGVSGAMMATPGWLFGDDPFLTLSFYSELTEIRRKIADNHLEKMLKELFLTNEHTCFALLNPQEGLETVLQERLTDRLSRIKAAMSGPEIECLVQETRELRDYQQRRDDPESLASIPLLELSDIDPVESDIPVRQEDAAGVPMLFVDEFSRGIVYFSLYLDAGAVSQELIPYLQLFNQLIGLLATERYSYGELEDQINLHTGGISSALNPLPVLRDDTQLRSFFALKGKVMPEKSAKLLELMREQLLHSSWSKDPERLRELIVRMKAQTEQGLAYNGLSIAAIRVSSYFSNRGAYRELIGGHSYYLFLCDLVDQFDRKLGQITENLQRVQARLVNRRGLLLSLTCQPEQAEALRRELGGFLADFPDFPVQRTPYRFVKETANEAFKDASKVQYVVKGGDYRSLGYSYNGRMEVLSQLLSTVYLQNTVRVMGGAYGGFAMLSDNGSLLLASYRDPNLDKTIQVYNQTADFLRDLQLSERELRRLIIGAISKRDYPLDPAQKAIAAVERHLSRIGQAQRQQERTEILTTRLEDLRAYAELLAGLMIQNNLCVVGNEQLIQERAGLFKSVLNLRR